MTWNRLLVTAVTACAFVTAGSVFAADDAAPGQHDRMAAWATKLGLTDQQKEQVQKIRTDFDRQADPLEEQLWALHHEEHEAMRKVLTDEQRAKLPAAIKAEMDRECQEVASKLGLSEEQKQKVRAIREEYEPKFQEIARQSTDTARKQVHELRSEFFTAVRKELNEEQRGKFWGVLREEFRQWRDPVARHERLNAVAERLGVNADQKDQLKKITAEYQPKIDKASAQLQEMWH